jgi:hypothetical protein
MKLVLNLEEKLKEHENSIFRQCDMRERWKGN